MADIASRDLQVRRAVYSRFAEGGVPSASDVAADLRIDIRAVRECYQRLAAAHVLVLDSRSREVWMAMPFSAVPTSFRVDESQALLTAAGFVGPFWSIKGRGV